MYHYKTSKTQHVKRKLFWPIVIFVASLYPLSYFITSELPKFETFGNGNFFSFILHDFSERLLLLLIFLIASGILIYALLQKNALFETFYEYQLLTKDDTLFSKLAIRKVKTTRKGQQIIDQKDVEQPIFKDVSLVDHLKQKKVTRTTQTSNVKMNLQHSSQDVRNLDNPVGVYNETSTTVQEKIVHYKDGSQKVFTTPIPLETIEKFIKNL